MSAATNVRRGQRRGEEGGGRAVSGFDGMLHFRVLLLPWLDVLVVEDEVVHAEN